MAESKQAGSCSRLIPSDVGQGLDTDQGHGATEILTDQLTEP